MTEFENNVRLLRYWQGQHKIIGNQHSREKMDKYAKLVDDYLEEVISPSIKFE